MPVTIGNGPTSEVGRIVNFRDASQLRSALNAAAARKSQPEAEKYREKKACKEAAEASQALLDIYERKWPKFLYVFRNVTDHQPDELTILSERIGGPTYRASMWSLLSKYSPDVSQANRTAWQECKDNDERGLYVLCAWMTAV